MSPSLMVPNCTNGFKKLFVYESREAAEGFLHKNNLTIDVTPILVPFRGDYGIQFLKPADLKGNKSCIRIMGAGNEIRNKNLLGEMIDLYAKTFGKDFAPHIDDLVGDDVLLEENGLIVIYQRAEKNGGARKVGKAFAEFFLAETAALKKKIKESNSNDAVRINTGEFTQGLSSLAVGLGGIVTGMTYFIKDGEVFRHTFKKGVSNLNMNAYLHAEPAEVQEVRVNYNKTNNNHVLAFLKDWLKGTVFAAITAIGVGLISSIFLIAFIAAPIAVVTFIALSVIAFYKASKDNQKTIEFGNPEFEIIKPEAVKQENSIFNQLKSDLLMVLAYLKGKSSADKQAVNPVPQPVQNEVAEPKLPVIAQTDVTPPVRPIEEPRPIPVMRVMPRINEQRSTLFSKQPALGSVKNKKQFKDTKHSTKSSLFKPIVEFITHMRGNDFNNNVYNAKPVLGMGK